MKKLFKRVFGIAASAALLVTSSMTAFAADPGHNHNDGKPITTSPSPAYTITLTHSVTDTSFDTNSKYGAYQIFSGTVKGTPDYDNPGTTSTPIPITDVKWGNAFGIVGEESATETTIHQNILGFVYALSQAKGGSYSYAFGGFDGFDDLFDDNKLNSAYVKDDTTEVTVTKSGGKVTISNDEQVNYDKLAVHISDVLAEDGHVDDHEWLQAFTDILGGYAQGTDGYANKGYVDRYYEGSIKSDDSTKYEITVPAGYYMIRELSGFSGTDKSYSARMLFVADNVNQVLKESIPTLDKKILRDKNNEDPTDGKDYFETEAAGVGDEVDFRLTGTLPDNYNLYLGGYQYKFTDTLSKGLTLKEISSGNYVTVKVKNVYDDKGELVKDDVKEYTISKIESYKTDGTHTTKHEEINAAYTESYEKDVLTVTFPCLKEIVIKGEGDTTYYIGADSEIYIDYTAVVNENAIVSPKDGTNDNGNFNTAQIQYSDNPQAYGDTDYTTTDRATVYTFGLDITKVDAADFLRNGGKTGAELKDVQFMLARPVATTLGSDGKTTADTEWEVATLTLITKDEIDSMNPATTVESFKENGYYSIVSWSEVAGETGATFDPSWVTSKEVTDGADGNVIKTVDKGILNISGLDVEVLYSLAEVTAPTTDPKGEDANYAKINPFTFKLSAQMNTEETEYTGRLSNAESPEDTNASFSFDKPVDITGTFDDTNDGSADMIVANFKYIDLPSTGGVGTYLFYILGAGGLAISFLLFKMSRKKAVN